MPSRTASCSWGQLRIQVEGEPRGVSVCHCLACQNRIGSAFATLASCRAPFRISGAATEYVRVGDQGAKFVFRFCPVCGTTVFHTQEGVNDFVSGAVGALSAPAAAQNWTPEQQKIWAFEEACWQRELARELAWIDACMHPHATSCGIDHPVPRNRASVARWDKYAYGNATVLESELFPLSITTIGGDDPKR